MTNSEKKLMQKMMSNLDSYEMQNADGPMVEPSKEFQLAAMKGNPSFKAQFDITVTLAFFTVALGVYTSILPAALHATLKQKLTAFFFALTDWSAGYARLKQAFPLTNWIYDVPFIYGADSNPAINGVAIDANVKGVLLAGDLVIPVYATAGGTAYVGLTIVRCAQTAFGSLLSTLASDRFYINNIRYFIDTVAYGQNQFTNNIYITKQSIFGKFEQDFVSPNAFKKPEQFQNGIIDVPIETGFDKQKGLSIACNFDTPVFQWSVFVRSIDKMQA